MKTRKLIHSLAAGAIAVTFASGAFAMDSVSHQRDTNAPFGTPAQVAQAARVIELRTWLLSILDGQRRYAHVAGLRGDAVAPQILGMTRIVSDESLRRALAHLAPTIKRCRDEDKRAVRQARLAKSAAWMDSALGESTHEALSTGWTCAQTMGSADSSVTLRWRWWPEISTASERYCGSRSKSARTERENILIVTPPTSSQPNARERASKNERDFRNHRVRSSRI